MYILTEAATKVAEDTLCNDNLKTILGFLKVILNLIKILIPAGLVIIGSIDLGKAVLANDEKEIKASQQILIKRAISALLVFFIVTIVTFAMGIVGGDEWNNCWKDAEFNKTNLKT